MMQELAAYIIVGLAVGWVLQTVVLALIGVLHHERFCRWLALLLAMAGFGYMPFSDGSLVPFGLIGAAWILAEIVGPEPEPRRQCRSSSS
jgi:hypothetical protein